MRSSGLAGPLLGAAALVLVAVSAATPQQDTGQGSELPQSGQAPAGTAAPGAGARRLSTANTNRLLGTDGRETGAPAEVLTLTPGELIDRDVVTIDDEPVGALGEIVSTGGQIYAIVEHGGFLGIGEDRISIPIEQIGLRGEVVILLGLSEQQLEMMPEYDYTTDKAVAADEPISIGRYD